MAFNHDEVLSKLKEVEAKVQLLAQGQPNVSQGNPTRVVWQKQTLKRTLVIEAGGGVAPPESGLVHPLVVADLDPERAQLFGAQNADQYNKLEAARSEETGELINESSGWKQWSLV